MDKLTTNNNRARGETAAVKREVRTDNAAVKREVRTDNAAVKREVRTDNAAVKREMRTDIAAELAVPKKIFSDDVCTVSAIRLDEKLAQKYKKAVGLYTTIESRSVTAGETEHYARLSRAVAKTLRTYSSSPKSVLVVGLGNANMTADALGCLTADLVRIDLNRLFAVKPGVMGSTGIESYEMVKGLVDRLAPPLVIVIDSLAAASVDRLCNVIQFSDGGITPGSGIDNHRKTISKDTLGTEVVSIGVPLVVYASTIISEQCDCDITGDYVRSLVVTPKDIDLLVRDSAKIIADGINLAYGNF